MRPWLRHGLAVLAALSGLALAPVLASADGTPTNDAKASPQDVAIEFGDARYAAAATDFVGLANAAPDPGDPDLNAIDVTGNAGSTCDDPNATDPGYGTHTVWYRLTWPQESGAATDVVAERAAVQLSTFDLTYDHAIAVLRDGVLVHCEAQNVRRFPGGPVHSTVDFVARPGSTYLVEVAGLEAPPDSDAAVLLLARAVDLTPPRFRLQTGDVAPQPGTSTTFSVLDAIDAGGIDRATVHWSATWEGGKPLAASRLSTGPAWNAAKVAWPAAMRPAGRYVIVRASVADASGNRSTVALRILIKDRTPPKVTRFAVDPIGRSLRVRAKCSEAGTVELSIVRQGRGRPFARKRLAVTPGKARQLTSRPLPARAVWIVRARCTDASGNWTQSALGFFG